MLITKPIQVLRPKNPFLDPSAVDNVDVSKGHRLIPDLLSAASSVIFSFSQIKLRNSSLCDSSTKKTITVSLRSRVRLTWTELAAFLGVDRQLLSKCSSQIVKS